MYKPPLIRAELVGNEWTIEVADKRKFAKFDRLFTFIRQDLEVRIYTATLDQIAFRSGKRRVSDEQREKSRQQALRMMTEGRGIFSQDKTQ